MLAANPPALLADRVEELRDGPVPVRVILLECNVIQRVLELRWGTLRPASSPIIEPGDDHLHLHLLNFRCSRQCTKYDERLQQIGVETCLSLDGVVRAGSSSGARVHKRTAR